MKLLALAVLGVLAAQLSGCATYLDWRASHVTKEQAQRMGHPECEGQSNSVCRALILEAASRNNKTVIVESKDPK